MLDGLIAPGLHTPEFLIKNGAAGLERALAALWPDVPAQISVSSNFLFRREWRTRHDSNVRPSPSEGDALSS